MTNLTYAEDEQTSYSYDADWRMIAVTNPLQAEADYFHMRRIDA